MTVIIRTLSVTWSRKRHAFYKSRPLSNKALQWWLRPKATWSFYSRSGSFLSGLRVSSTLCQKFPFNRRTVSTFQRALASTHRLAFSIVSIKIKCISRYYQISTVSPSGMYLLKCLLLSFSLSTAQTSSKTYPLEVNVRHISSDHFSEVVLISSSETTFTTTSLTCCRHSFLMVKKQCTSYFSVR